MFSLRKKLGFTLMELLVVVAIIGVLASFAFVVFGNARLKARDAKRMSDLNQLGRFLTFGCLVPTAGAGTYDLNDLIVEYKIKYPQYSSSIPNNIRDPKTGTTDIANYKYIVNNSNKCVLYANLENKDEKITLPDITNPIPGGGKGICESVSEGWNGSNKYFQISN